MSIEHVSYTHYADGYLCSCMIAASQLDHPVSETAGIHSHSMSKHHA